MVAIRIPCSDAAFELARAPREGEVSVSIKVRVTSGCFHREHSPHAYALIDKQLVSRASRRPDFTFVEHESGPELLVYVALATAGITLTASVIDLVVAIIQARSEGIENGERPSDPLEIVVRRVGEGDKFVEETVLRVGHADPANAGEIEARTNAALQRLLQDMGGLAGSRAKQRRTRHSHSRKATR